MAIKKVAAMAKTKAKRSVSRVTKKAPLQRPHKKAVPKKRVRGKTVPRKKQALKKPTSLLSRIKENPIILPRPENDWESWQTFNPAAILLEGRVHFLYRAIGSDGISRLGYAASGDGFSIDERLEFPVYEHALDRRSFTFFPSFSGGSWGGAEDPRIVRVENEDVLYMTYTICDAGGLGVGLTSITIDDFLNKRWNWTPPELISPAGEVHKNWVIFPEKINGKYAILHSINPEIKIDYFDSLEGARVLQSTRGNQPRKNCWDKWVRGVGPVPVKTKYGWLVFYHAMDDDRSKYKVGAMLLDANDPTIILHRSRIPLLEPEEQYEHNGFKGGVVYASGAVVKDGKILIYYGSADSYVCVASADFDEFVESLHKDVEPRLNKKMFRKKT